MYPEYFGLKEPSFSITPDPQYLYLSREHREALAHLLYGTGDSGGFVLLTGEVGTGKTTVCRAFLEQLPEQVDVALILNPALTAPELLHTVCVEFGVEVAEGETSAKVLVDRLNGYLLESHAKGRRPVLMIDEAQNLHPEVLEQVRLLTNLETAKHKLLQIFLVGQPELRELLQQPGLRQLAQRITARYHLPPLGANETAEYIRHRLAVAGVERQLFTPAAVRRIYRHSGGVPRLINILCDRALLGGYATHSQVIDAGIVARAIHELAGERPPRRGRLLRYAGAALVLLLSAALGTYAWMGRQAAPPSPPLAQQSDEPPELPSVTPVETPEPPPAPAVTEETETAQPIEETPPEDAPPPPVAALPLPGLDELTSDRRSALALLLQQWSEPLPLPADFQGDPCDYAASRGLLCREGRGTWNNLRFYDRPALVLLKRPGGSSGYALVTGLGPERVTLEAGKTQGRYRLSRVEPLWFGDFLMLWRPPPGGWHLVGPGAPADAVRWLSRSLARAAGGTPDGSGPTTFGPQLQQAVERFQRERGLLADGIAGPETLIQLNSAAGWPNIPRLTDTR